MSALNFMAIYPAFLFNLTPKMSVSMARDETLQITKIRGINPWGTMDVQTKSVIVNL